MVPVEHNVRAGRHSGFQISQTLSPPSSEQPDLYGNSYCRIDPGSI